jgi:hypothetical protein
MEEMSCAICCDDFDSSNQIYSCPDNLKLSFCLSCANYMIENNFSRYIKEIADADCEKSLKSALSQPIPLYITIDSLKKSRQLPQILTVGGIIDTKLQKTISDQQLGELNEQFDQIKKQIDNNDVFDYLGTIKKLLTQYNLG